MTSLSRSDLMAFLDYLASKGLVNQATASARKAAVNKVLGVLDDDEATDVSKLDLDVLMRRFHNLHGERYTPESLGAYKSRVRSAIDDFVRYQNDPLNFRPGLHQTGRRPTDKPKSERPPASRSEQRHAMSGDRPPTSVNILPIPIRADLTIMVQGLPFDLTIAEATKIGNVIRALATED